MVALIVIIPLVYIAVAAAFAIDCLQRGNKAKASMIACAVWPVTMVYAACVVVKEFVWMIVRDLI